MNVQQLPWVILFLPLLAAVVITLFTKPQRALSSFISIGAIVISFVASLILFLSVKETLNVSVNWLTAGDFSIPFGFQIDHLSLLMLLIVTGVGSAIHIFSYGYMHEDGDLSRFFASLSLFTFSMLGLVLSNNFFQMFIFWELVGVSSYLLIGFWYEKASAADASKKAFLTNRLGDFGFLLGILMVWGLTGSIRFDDLALIFKENAGVLGAFATAAGLLVFCGAVGKSAQFPLHVWLPDAMEGPTPVSALIHAATMVAAGVYMLCRVFFIFDPTALQVIAWIGVGTALLAALIAVQQNDIKRILAYSTLSQLGLMVMGVGMMDPAGSMFHLATHAFFKALLFLGAGSVIHAMHHEQDIWAMGNLRKRMPVTYWTFLLATLAIAGVPPLSGFFSKDALLAAAWHHNAWIFVIAVIVSILTSFYMFRLLFVAFLGTEKTEAASHAHESPRVMTLPLIFLAILTVIGGVIGLHEYIGHSFGVETHHTNFFEGLFAPFAHSPFAAFIGLLAAIAGFSAAYALYKDRSIDPFTQKFFNLSAAMRNRFYFDEIYNGLIRLTHENLAKLSDAFDRWIIGGLAVRGAHGVTELTGRALRLLQTGNLSTYTFLFVVGAAIVIYVVIFG